MEHFILFKLGTQWQYPAIKSNFHECSITEMHREIRKCKEKKTVLYLGGWKRTGCEWGTEANSNVRYGVISLIANRFHPPSAKSCKKQKQGIPSSLSLSLFPLQHAERRQTLSSLCIIQGFAMLGRCFLLWSFVLHFASSCSKVSSFFSLYSKKLSFAVVFSLFPLPFASLILFLLLC